MSGFRPSGRPAPGATPLVGKVAVVVGAGSMGDGWSNGKASAVSYAAAGASVVCVDFHLERAEETAKLIERAGGQSLAVQADATREDDMVEVMEAALTFGRLDVMHNNVGVGSSMGTPDQITPDQWDREIAQNLTTAYLGVRCAAPHMKAQGGGVITNISSLLAVRFLGKPNVGYTASKAAVEALTRSCAAAYGRNGIRVNCIRIGFSETPLLMAGLSSRNLPPEREAEEMDRSRRKVPLRNEHSDAFDVADAAVFLASDAARHITGVVLNVDGGLECAPI